MKIVGHFSTRIQLLLHRFPLLLGQTNTTWVLPLDPSIFLLLLDCPSSLRHMERNQHGHILLPSSIWSLDHWLILNSPRILCSCRSPNSINNSAQDGWQISSTKSWTFSISIHLFCTLEDENVASLADIPNLFCRNWKILLMHWWFVYSMFLNSGEDAASFLVLLELECFLSSLSVWSWSSRSFLFGFGFLVGLVNGSPRSFRSTCELDTDAGSESVPHMSAFALFSLSLDTVIVGEVDELEEDVGWSISCFEGVIDVEEGKLEEKLADKPGTTIGTKFSVLHCIHEFCDSDAEDELLSGLVITLERQEVRNYLFCW